MNEIEVPKMLEEVWKMKDSVYKDIKNMSTEQIFSYIHNKTIDFTKKTSS